MLNEIPISLIDAAVGYKSHRKTVSVLQHLDASLQRGMLTCLIGQNGVGKSTLMRTIAGFQPVIDGQVQVYGQNVESMTQAQLAKQVAVVLTEKPDVQNMTVYDMIAMGRTPYTGFWGNLKDEDCQVVEHAIAQVGIYSLSKRMVDTLSDGERQKVMIAKALAQQTPVICLDEPTAFLDYPSKVEMMLILKRLCRDEKKSILMSTHDLELALQLADLLWLVSADGSLSIGSPKELADNELSRFVERNGIHLDADTLTIRVEVNDGHHRYQ